MVFTVVVLLYYWFTGDEIWYGASIGWHEPGLRARAIEGARCALTARQRPQPPTVGVMAGGRHLLLWAQLVSAGVVAAYSSPSCLCWGLYQIS